MARPKKYNADYFSHDADMRNDPKIRALRSTFGHEGYSIYNMLIEFLTDQDYFKYELNDLNYEILAGDFVIDQFRLKQIIDYLIKLDLFQLNINDNILSNKTLNNRLEQVLSRRKPQSSGVNVDRNPQSKVKDSKGEGSKVDYNIETELLNSKIWIEEVAMNQKLSPGVTCFKLQSFLNEQKLVGGLDRSLNEVKKHFINSLKYKSQNNNQPEQSTVYTPPKELSDYEIKQREETKRITERMKRDADKNRKPGPMAAAIKEITKKNNG